MERQHDELTAAPGSPEWLRRAGDALTVYFMQDIDKLPAASGKEVSKFPHNQKGVNPTEDHE